jgi:hypothetical protein
MHKPDKIFTSKKTVYFDHNILNHIIRHPEISLFKEIATDNQVVYSDETLREIKRSVGGEKDLLNILVNLNAMHLKVYHDENFDPTDDAVLSEADPFATFERTCAEDSIIDKLNAATQTSLRKFYGDKKLSDFDELADEHGIAFQTLLSDLVEGVCESPLADSLYISRLRGFVTRLLANRANAYRQSIMMMQDYKGDGTKSAVKVYRDTVGIGPKELNNIAPPNTIEKIWELHMPLPGYKGREFTIEDFLGITLIPHSVKGTITDFQKIISAYNVLNVVGYRNDSDMKHERRFTSSMSDANHVAFASFTDYIYSSDAGLTSKAAAIYEFLKINTKICRVNIIDNR